MGMGFGLTKGGPGQRALSFQQAALLKGRHEAERGQDAGGHFGTSTAWTGCDSKAVPPGSRRQAARSLGPKRKAMQVGDGPKVDAEGFLVVSAGCGFWVAIFKLLLP